MDTFPSSSSHCKFIHPLLNGQAPCISSPPLVKHRLPTQSRSRVAIKIRCMSVTKCWQLNFIEYPLIILHQRVLDTRYPSILPGGLLQGSSGERPLLIGSRPFLAAFAFLSRLLGLFLLFWPYLPWRMSNTCFSGAHPPRTMSLDFIQLCREWK